MGQEYKLNMPLPFYVLSCYSLYRGVSRRSRLSEYDESRIFLEFGGTVLNFQHFPEDFNYDPSERWLVGRVDRYSSLSSSF